MLQTGTLAFLAGIILLQTRAVLPATWLIYLLPLSLVGICLPMLRHARLLCWLLAGFLWALYQAQGLIGQRLPASLEHHNLQVTGVIASLPQSRGLSTRFDFLIDHASTDVSLHFPSKLRLSWYGKSTRTIKPGQVWQLTVRLHTPHSFMDPGAFDYTAWLLQKGIVATGYVVSKGDNQVIRQRSGRVPVQSLRYRTQHALKKLLGDSPTAGLVLALLIGDRSGINQSQWQLLRRTGTVHLMAISGLHIGFIAGLVFFLIVRLWRLFPSLCLLLPAPRAAALIAWLVACCYAALAGFSIPTQRALIMLAVFLFSIWFQRTTRPSMVVALALLLVLLSDPFAVLSIGFWLSFSAVSLIYFVLQFQQRGTPRLVRWWRMQWAISLGMLPLLVVFFQQAPLISPIANLLAIPFVSLAILPLALLSLCLIPISPTLASSGLHLAANALQGLLSLLAWMASWPLNLIHLPTPGYFALTLALIGLVVMLLPRRFPARYLGMFLMLPLFLPVTFQPPLGAARLSLLDVGQGLSAIVQTHEHTLIFDTGPRYGPGLNAGDAVIIPYLRQQDISRIDALLVSHSDLDHIGGARSLLRAMPISQVVSNVPRLLRGSHDQNCFAGQHWRWDGVEFEILYPTPAEYAQARKNNNRSCVLQVTTKKYRLLLTADIEKVAEEKLLVRDAKKLRSEVLVIPHHGSKTSSSSAFLSAVNPKLALISSGWHNRFHLPARVLLTRLHGQPLRLLNTASVGATTVDLGNTLRVETFRQRRQRYWQTW